MSLADLVRGKPKSVPSVATATPATFATHGMAKPLTVASVATVAVANAQSELGKVRHFFTALIATAANEAQTLSPIQNQVKGLSRHAWQRLAASMTPERWANIAELMASADDGARFLSDWTARNIAAVNIAHGIVSPEQTRAVICRACGPVFTHRARGYDRAGQDGTEHGLDCVLSCEWCGRGVPSRRPELGGMIPCF